MKRQLNALLQRFTHYKLVYCSNKVTTGTGDDYKPTDFGTTLIARAYTSQTDPCQDGYYLIGKYS